MSSRTVTTVTRTVKPTNSQAQKVNVGTPYVSESVKHGRRKGITIFRYVQVRRYAFVPADFLIQLKGWFEKQHFIIKKNTRGYGYLAGRRDGIHLNFVPKFLIHVEQEADHTMVTLTYAARIRKIGIAAAILTEGLTAIIGAATLTSHVAHARSFMETVTEEMDRTAGVLLGVTWCEAVEGGKEVTTTTTETLPPIESVRTTTPVPPAPVVAPAPVPVHQQQAAPSTVVVASQAPRESAPQPQIIVVQTPAPMMYPYPPPPYHHNMMGYPQHPMGYPQQPPMPYPQHNNMLPPPPQVNSMPPPPSPPSVSLKPALLSNTRYPTFEQNPQNPQMQSIEYPSTYSSQPPVYSAPPSTYSNPYTTQPSYSSLPTYNSYPSNSAPAPYPSYAPSNSYVHQNSDANTDFMLQKANTTNTVPTVGIAGN